MTNLYKILGVAPTASGEKIRAQYRRLARELHPDRGGDLAAFKELSAAYEVLGDAKARSSYEASRADWIKEVSAVACPECGEANSLRKIKIGGVAQCGDCGATLPAADVNPLKARAREIARSVGEQVVEHTGDLAIEAVGWGFSKLRQGLGFGRSKGKAR